VKFFSLPVSFAESLQVEVVAFGKKGLRGGKMGLSFVVAFVIAFDVLAPPLWVYREKSIMSISE
jgi:hypothetical protein